MGIRISTTLDLIAGQDNSLDNKIFGGTSQLSELLDTLEHGLSVTMAIDPGETGEVEFEESIVTARYVYIEADGEFALQFTNASSTRAIVDGVGGSYPTGFTGGETLTFDVNGTTVAVVFDAADQTLDQVIARINFVAALAGFVSNIIATNTGGGQLRLISPTAGSASEIDITGGTALVTLGLSIGTATGTDAVPGTAPIMVKRPADPSGANAAEGVKSYFLGTVETTDSIEIENIGTGVLNVIAFVAGDLVATP